MNNTIKEVYQNYLESSKLKNKLTTVQHEYYKFINYVIPFFGNKKIGDITKNDFISCGSKSYFVIKSFFCSAYKSCAS